MIFLIVNVVSASRVSSSKIATERALLEVSNANNFISHSLNWIILYYKFLQIPRETPPLERRIFTSKTAQSFYYSPLPLTFPVYLLLTGKIYDIMILIVSNQVH